MAIAGKVAITLSTENGGAWSADVTYDRLVAVKHNNNLYISRKTVANVEPPNDEFWFLALEGFGGEDVEALIDRMNELSGLIQAIINGTTQVGNAKTLDGHGAEYFFTKSGGTIDGNVTVKKESGQLVFNFKNGSRHMAIVLTEAGVCGVLDETNKVWLWNSELNGTTKFYGHASEDLPLTADSSMSTRTVGRSSNNPLILKNTNSGNNQSYIGFATESHGTMGFLGYIGANNPVCILDGTANTLLHTGNKPTGTYTGNGDATERTIATGGIGDVLFVNTSGGAFYIVSKYGAIVKGYEGLTFYGSAKVKFESGTLTITSDDIVLNGSSYRYTYQVL